MTHNRIQLALLCCTLLAPPTLLAQDDAKADKEAKKETPETVVVQKEPIRVQEEIEGVFVADKSTEVVLRPEAWTDWKVESVVEHGERVRKGDEILKLESEALEQAIADLESQAKLAALVIEANKRDQPREDAARRLELQVAEIASKTAKEDFDYYHKVQKEFGEKSAKISLESSEAYLEYAMEELNQLEQMYEEDDLTEQTEEIILKRQRRAVEMAKHSLEQARLSHDQYFQFRMPRFEQSLAQQQQSSALSLQQAQLAAQVATGQKQLAMQKAERDLEQSKQKLTRMVKDRQWLVIRAAQDGVVYYGRSVDGKWPNISTLAAQLVTGGAVKPRDVLLTIVEQDIRKVVAKLPEKNLGQAKPGLQASVRPTGMPDKKLSAVVDSISAIPIADGQFRAELRLIGADQENDLVAGMTCKLMLEVYRKADALTLPKTAVGTDELDDTRYVTMLDDEGKQERRAVEVGHTKGDLIEILAGINQGDRVLKNADGKKKE